MRIKKYERSLGSRNLRIGKRGSDVAKLQSRLQELGYEPGPDDGQFGYLTQEALEYFQRDYRLRIDGIAGHEVFSLMLQDELPINRLVHTVAPGESIIEIAKAYGVGVQAFRNWDKGEALYPGQKLIFFDRQVWGIEPTTMLAKRSYERNRHSLTGRYQPLELLQTSLQPKSSEKTIIGRISLPEEDPKVYLHKLLISRKRRRECMQFFETVRNTLDGIYLPWDSVARVDGGRYLAFIRHLRRVLGSKQLVLRITPRMPWWHVLFGGIRFLEVGTVADQIVLSSASLDMSRPIVDTELLEQLIQKVVEVIPAWKILLEIPVYAVIWAEGEADHAPEIVSYQAAMSKVFRYGAKQVLDENDRPYFRYYDKDRVMRLQIPSQDQIVQLIGLTNRYNLAGIVIDRLGMEDGRVWSKLQSQFRVGKFS